MAKRNRGFGFSLAQHEIRFRGRLWALQHSLNSAERVLRGGDCQAGVDEFAQAFQEYGEVEGEMRNLVSVSSKETAMFRKSGVRLNFLRQAMKRCVR